MRTLIDKEDVDDELSDQLAEHYIALGTEQSKIGDMAKAEEYVRKAIGIRERLVSEYPSLIDYKRSLAESYRYLVRVIVPVPATLSRCSCTSPRTGNTVAV